MTDRERLIQIVEISLIKYIDKSCRLAENIVDDLLTEGVTVTPVAFSDNRRERMVELLDGYYEETGMNVVHYFTDEESEMVADYILADGWIRPPCKVGDKVYLIHGLTDTKNIIKCTVNALHITSGKNRLQHRKPSHILLENEIMPRLTSRVYFEEFGKTVFLTREEAEKALKERETE